MSSKKSNLIIKPQSLQKGDCIGLITPASPLFEPFRLEQVRRFWDKLGYETIVGKHVGKVWGSYAGLDDERLEDMHSMFANKKVKAVLPLRGGNGAFRLLEKLDFKLIADNPKLFVGFSDITCLLLAIFQETGLITFHGPTANQVFASTYSLDNFFQAITTGAALGVLPDPHEPSSIERPPYPPYAQCIVEGAAEGQLIGGCLTLIRQMLGTPFEPDTKGKILFFEDVNEEPHSIDRMLSQLLLANKLQVASGIVIGECIDCQPGESGRTRLAFNKSTESVLVERLSGLKIPVVYGMRFGHGSKKLTLPVGACVRLKVSPAESTLEVLEAATLGVSHVR